MDEQQPELRWAPLPPPPKKTRKAWLIAGLAVGVLVIVGLLLVFLLPRGSDAGATPTPSSSSSVSPSPSDSPNANSSAAPSQPDPEETPLTTPPPADAPTLEVFQSRVSGWLNTAPRGLDIIADVGGQDALPVADTLLEDAQRLSDVQPPESIDQAWRDGVTAYADRLAQLRTAVENGSGISEAVDASRSAVEDLRSLADL